MNGMTFERFEEICRQQDAEIRTTIRVMACMGRQAFENIHTPTGMFAAIAEAGLMLNQAEPDLDLCNKVIDGADIGPDDIGAQTLLAILNASRRGTDQDSPSEAGSQRARFPHTLKEAVFACGEAEPFFYRTVADIMHADPSAPRNRVFHAHGNPVLLEKSLKSTLSRGQNTAMSLMPIEIASIPYPAGSYFNLAQSPRSRRAHGTARIGQTEVVPAAAVDKIGFLRVGACALAPEEREEFSRDSFEVPLSGAAREVSQLPLDVVSAELAHALQLDRFASMQEAPLYTRSAA
jgi:hypothetical protein